MADVFGYTKDQQAGGVLSFTNVALKVGAEVQLVQSVNVQYQRQVTPVMAAGMATIFLCPQPPTGTLQATRAIGGTAKVASDWKTKGYCELETINIVNTGKATCGSVPNCQLTAEGMFTGYTFTLNTGAGVSVTDGASYTLSDIH